MNNPIKTIVFFSCAIGSLFMAVFFFFRSSPIEIDMPALTVEKVKEYQAMQRDQQAKKQSAAYAKWKAEIETKIYQCSSNEECIIVDKDPCGCLKGPEGVVAINSALSLEFSRLMQSQIVNTTVCPSRPSYERECSASARAMCVENHCKIVY